DRHRGVEAELGAHEDDGAVDPRPRESRSVEYRVDARGERFDSGEKLAVLLRCLLRRGPEVVEEADGALAGELPAVRVDVPEDGRPVRVPAPGVVVGDRGERLQPRGQPLGEEVTAQHEVGGPRSEHAARQALSSITSARSWRGQYRSGSAGRRRRLRG